MAEDDQVGEIGAGEKERAGIRQKKASVKECRLSSSPLTGRVDEDRREECDRGVEIQHSRHCHDEHDGTDVEDQTIRCQTSERVSGSGEQPVLVGDETHQRSPATRTNGDQSCAAADRAWSGAEDRRDDAPHTQGRQRPPSRPMVSEGFSSRGGRSPSQACPDSVQVEPIATAGNKRNSLGLPAPHPLDPPAQFGRASGPLRPHNALPNPNHQLLHDHAGPLLADGARPGSPDDRTSASRPGAGPKTAWRLPGRGRRGGRHRVESCIRHVEGLGGATGGPEIEGWPG